MQDCDPIVFDKYEKLGAYHWRDYQHDTTYRKHVDYLISIINPTHSILDVGAGDGLITYMLKALGIDDNRLAVSLAKEYGANVIEGSAYALPNGPFDTVLLGDVIEHLQYPERCLAECLRVMKKQLVIATPPASDVLSKYHYQEFTPQSLDHLLDKSGFARIRPITIHHCRMYAVYEPKTHKP